MPRLDSWVGLAQRWQRLRDDSRGLALTEFAFTLPLFMILMASGLELSNYVITAKRVGDLTAMAADNASRMGEKAGPNITQISEADINDVFTGLALQSDTLNLLNNGRVILSSLQRNAQGGQWIAWQRCFGNLPQSSSYGQQGAGATGTSFPGMGPPGQEIKAAPNTAVMVVEIIYDYKRIVPVAMLPVGQIRELAAFNVRDNRDLTQINNAENVAPATCT